MTFGHLVPVPKGRVPAPCAPVFLQTLPDATVLIQRKKADNSPLPLICSRRLSSRIS